MRDSAGVIDRLFATMDNPYLEQVKLRADWRELIEDNPLLLWMAISLELWYRVFVGGESLAALGAQDRNGTGR